MTTEAFNCTMEDFQENWLRKWSFHLCFAATRLLKHLTKKILWRVSCKEAPIIKWSSTSHSKTKIIATGKNDNKVNTGARRINQKHIYMTIQVTTPKLPAQMLENSSREPKAFAEVKYLHSLTSLLQNWGGWEP